MDWWIGSVKFSCNDYHSSIFMNLQHYNLHLYFPSSFVWLFNISHICTKKNYQSVLKNFVSSCRLHRILFAVSSHPTNDKKHISVIAIFHPNECLCNSWFMLTDNWHGSQQWSCMELCLFTSTFQSLRINPKLDINETNSIILIECTR